MAAQFRMEFLADETMDRSNIIFGFARQMKRLADEHDFAVLCINQVSDHMASGNGVNSSVTSSIFGGCQKVGVGGVNNLFAFGFIRFLPFLGYSCARTIMVFLHQH